MEAYPPASPPSFCRIIRRLLLAEQRHVRLDRGQLSEQRLSVIGLLQILAYELDLLRVQWDELKQLDDASLAAKLLELADKVGVSQSFLDKLRREGSRTVLHLKGLQLLRRMPCFSHMLAVMRSCEGLGMMLDRPGYRVGLNYLLLKKQFCVLMSAPRKPGATSSPKEYLPEVLVVAYAARMIAEDNLPMRPPRIRVRGSNRINTMDGEEHAPAKPPRCREISWTRIDEESLSAPPGPRHEAAQAVARRAAEVVETLPLEQALVVQARYFTSLDEVPSLRSVAAQVGFSKNKVSKLLKLTLQTLANDPELLKLWDSC